MALPKLDVPIYELKLPSNNKKVSYRPFLVKEEKILLMAMEGEDQGEITIAIKQIINNCIIDNLDIDAMPLFDLEYILVNLRARSMGDIIKTNYVNRGCKEDNCKPIEIEIDVNDIKIEKDPTHSNKIELTDEVGMIMNYPNIETTSLISSLKKVKSDDAFDLIIGCIDKIYDKENVYSKADYTPEEIKDFIEGLTQDQFRKIEHFFNTIPKMYQNVNFNCERCGYKEEMRLEGLESFFG